MIAHWLYVHFGIAGSGPWYSFWSGIGSDLAEITLLGAAIGLFRHHNCSVTGCLRTRTYPVNTTDGRPTPYKSCRRHHPHMDETVRVTPDRLATWGDRHPSP